MVTIKSIEEKAKRYDEAIERAKEMIKDMTIIGGVAKVDDIQYLFPELKDSEDERIKKAIKQVLNESTTEKDECYLDNRVTQQEVFAWLEKQGDKYSVWVGGVEVNDYYLSKDEAEKLAYKYRKEDYDDVVVEKQGEQKPAEWNKNDEVLLDETLHFIREFQQSDRCIDEGDMQNSVTCENWLKSLKNRYTWKPSDEQMDVLLSEVTAWTKGCPKQIVLESIYNDLKKLKEE